MRISTMGLMALGMGFGVQGGNPIDEGGKRLSSEPVHFDTDWEISQKPTVAQAATVKYTYTDTGVAQWTWMTLCQTNATTLPLAQNNTWSIILLPICPDGTFGCNRVIEKDFTRNGSFNFTPPEGNRLEKGLQNFFFCFGTAPGGADTLVTNIPPIGMTCESFSPFFDIAPAESSSATASVTGQSIPAASGQSISAAPSVVSGGRRRSDFSGNAFTAGLAASPPSGLPSNVLSITSSTFVIQSVMNGFASSSSQATTPVTVTGAPTGTTTLPAPIETSPPPRPTSSSEGGLSLGAKIGIGLGALGFVLIILLLALFCLRRRHAKRSISRSEQVMLTQSVHNESRDLVTEKEIATAAALHHNDHDTDNDTDSGPPVLPVSKTRHSALSPYETLPSQPYKGSAAAIPRRKTGSAPTSAGSDTLTRAISTHSERTIEIPPSIARASNEHQFEEYHDVPMYSTARAFQGSFLGSEDGRSSSAANTTSEEEARRLEEASLEEEEERRIDAAIAEAERKRGTLR